MRDVRVHRWLAVVAALAAMAGGMLVTVSSPPAHAAHACVDAVPGQYRACFTDGTSSSTLLFDDAAARLDSTVSGDSVRIAMYQWHAVSSDPLLEAVRRAKARGVSVRVLLGNALGSNKPGTAGAGQALVDALGSENVLNCTEAIDNWGCLKGGTNRPGLMHNKFVLIDHAATGAKEVITFSSNITTGQFARSQNSVTVANNADAAALHGGYLSYWNRMVARSWGDWSSDSSRTVDGVSGNKAFFFPRENGDPLASIIAEKSCAGDSEEIRVLSSDDDFRPALVSALSGAKQRGCDVKITIADEAARASFAGSAITSADITYAPTNHNKVVLLRTRTTPTSALDDVVFVGSHNVGLNALLSANDVMLRLKTPQVVAAYRTYVESIQNPQATTPTPTPTPTPTSTPTPTPTPTPTTNPNPPVSQVTMEGRRVKVNVRVARKRAGLRCPARASVTVVKAGKVLGRGRIKARKTGLKCRVKGQITLKGKAPAKAKVVIRGHNLRTKTVTVRRG